MGLGRRGYEAGGNPGGEHHQQERLIDRSLTLDITEIGFAWMVANCEAINRSRQLNIHCTSYWWFVVIREGSAVWLKLSRSVRNKSAGLRDLKLKQRKD